MCSHWLRLAFRTRTSPSASHCLCPSEVLLKQCSVSSVLLRMFAPVWNVLPIPYLLSHSKRVQLSNSSSFLKTQLSPLLEQPSSEPHLLADPPTWDFFLACKLIVLSFIFLQVCSTRPGILESPTFILHILCL